jgi:hypothetical protein
MRISTLLLFLFLSGLVVAGVAPARGQSTVDALQSESSRATWVVPSTNLDLASAHDLAIDQYRLRKHWDENLGHFTIDNIRPAHAQVCYTMRTYKVEGSERYNDATEPMKYSTCQPSSGFDVKNADVHVVEPEEPRP